MSSLVKTLPRWYWTVRGDRNSRAPISGLTAIAGQPGDLRLLSGQLDPGGDGALAGGLAGGLQLAAGPPGERLQAHFLQHAVRGAQLLARLTAAPLPA